MPDSSAALIGWTIALLCAFGSGGRLWPSAPVWKFADLFYYPLGACGVVLLFFATEANRTLDRLEGDRAALKSDYAAHLNKRPQVKFETGSIDLLAARFDWFVTARQLGAYCAASSTPGCFTHHRHGELITEAFQDFDPRAGPRDSEARVRLEAEYCTRGLSLLEESREKAVLTEAFDLVRVSLGHAEQGASEGEIARKLGATISTREAALIASLDPPIRAASAANISAEAKFALDLFGRLAWCMQRNPRDQESLYALDLWAAEERGRAAKISQLQQRIEKAAGRGVETRAERIARSLAGC